MRLSSLLDPFRPKRADPETVLRVKAWAREALGGSSDLAFAVNEIVCRDPSCPGVETVILVMEPGLPTRAVKLPKTLDTVTERDVREAL